MVALSTQKYDFLIVGAGLFGCMFAHLATRRGKKCLVIDKRPLLGGNLYCERLEGIHVHRYGALVNDSHNSELYARYKAVADKEKNVIFGGRLAEYKYYDMAPIVDKELSMFD